MQSLSASDLRMLDACAKRHGWNGAQKEAARNALAAAPASLPVPGKPHLMAPVPLYDIMLEAAARAHTE